LAGAYMVVIMELAWAAQRERVKSRTVELLILAKVTSSLIALAYFVLAVHAFAFLANFAVDGAIALVTYLLHRQVKPSTATQAA